MLGRVPLNCSYNKGDHPVAFHKGDLFAATKKVVDKGPAPDHEDVYEVSQLMYPPLDALLTTIIVDRRTKRGLLLTVMARTTKTRSRMSTRTCRKTSSSKFPKQRNQKLRLRRSVKPANEDI